jgi:hypothetical protein
MEEITIRKVTRDEGFFCLFCRLGRFLENDDDGCVGGCDGGDDHMEYQNLWQFRS